MPDNLLNSINSVASQFLAGFHIITLYLGQAVSDGIIWGSEILVPDGSTWGMALDLNWIQSAEFQSQAGTSVVISIFVLLILVRLMFRRNTKEHIVKSLNVATRRPKIYGLIAVFGLVIFIGGWSAFAPLASAALAPGVVSPAGDRKTVEHLEGGIVRTIHVREGDTVEAGSALVTLEDIQAKAHFAQLRKRYLHLIATESRLLAERAGTSSIDFPKELESAPEADATSAWSAQQKLFENRRTLQNGRAMVLEKRISQLNEQNSGLDDVLAAQDRQLDLIQQEIDSVQDLFNQGLERRPRLLALQRAQAELEAKKAANRAKIAENGQKIGETEIQLLTMQEQVFEQSSNELVDVQRMLSEIRSQLPSREDILVRTVVRAPLSGTVMNIQPTTESGIIRPGEPILEIVPNQATLVVDAKVRPSDIDRIYKGMEARVILTAYRQRNLPLIHGTLRSISADRLEETRTGEPYYLAKIDVNKEDLIGLDTVKLIPGMPAEVMLLDESLTFFEYLIGPLSQSMDRSFREN